VARVIVVGGGISGLTTALALAGGDVTVELWEADERLGGKLLTTPFAGLPAVDEGSDAFLARVPEATALATEVGLADDLTSPTPARAAVWFDGLHAIPDGLLLGVPAGLGGLVTSRLLTIGGKVRAAVEPLLPRTSTATDAVGALIRHRFGDQVHERLVDALVGSIYAADTDRASLAVVPQLAALARSRSLLLGARRMRAATGKQEGPIFLAPRHGMGALVEAVAAAATDAGVAIHRRRRATQLARDGGRWRVDDVVADAVVLASPAAPTAPLVTAVAPDAARLLAAMDHAGVILVTMHVPSWPERLRQRSGYLVPKPVQRTVTAVSFGSQKWAHWRPPTDGEVLRVSLGRDGKSVDDLDDDQAVDRAVAEVAGHLGIDLQPAEVRVSRWPAAFPQYRPGHLGWRAGVTAALPPGLYVTGASYGGIGVPACIAQARATAARLLADLAAAGATSST
jgi:oxygen-dependent protoporphyrinogen oxidase